MPIRGLVRPRGPEMLLCVISKAFAPWHETFGVRCIVHTSAYSQRLACLLSDRHRRAMLQRKFSNIGGSLSRLTDFANHHFGGDGASHPTSRHWKLWCDKFRLSHTMTVV